MDVDRCSVLYVKPCPGHGVIDRCYTVTGHYVYAFAAIPNAYSTAEKGLRVFLHSWVFETTDSDARKRTYACTYHICCASCLGAGLPIHKQASDAATQHSIPPNVIILLINIPPPLLAAVRMNMLCCCVTHSAAAQYVGTQRPLLLWLLPRIIARCRA